MSNAPPSPGEAFGEQREKGQPGQSPGEQRETTGLLRMLFKTDAKGQTVEDIQQQYGVGSRGVATFLLGIVKMSESGGFPAVIDLLVGSFLVVQEKQAAQMMQQAAQSNDEGSVDERRQHMDVGSPE